MNHALVYSPGWKQLLLAVLRAGIVEKSGLIDGKQQK
jgi:hypothetical protein